MTEGYKFKINDIVKATDNDYGTTTKDNNWVGKVTKVGSHYFDADTISCDNGFEGFRFTELEYSDFELKSKPEPKNKKYFTKLEVNSVKKLGIEKSTKILELLKEIESKETEIREFKKSKAEGLKVLKDELKILEDKA